MFFFIGVNDNFLKLDPKFILSFPCLACLGELNLLAEVKSEKSDFYGEKYKFDYLADLGIDINTACFFFFLCIDDKEGLTAAEGVDYPAKDL